ncbi:MAG: periplasmic protein TonB [Blastocatellia bacterium]|jgi:protein TonB|nr:periplasmic protein TonB [Blastocatellia bacterium]
MFENMVESGSHKDDFARKGSFILGTLIVYGVLGVAIVVAGIWYQVAKIDSENLELTTLVAPIPVQQEQKAQPEEKPAEAAKVSTERQVATVREFVDTSMQKPPTEINTSAKGQSPPVRGAVRGTQDYIPPGGGATYGDPNARGPVGGSTGPAPIADEPPPPPPEPKPSPTPKPPPRAPISGGVLNGKAINLPKPTYPAIARSARASGTVVVQVTIDETGKVISARAVSGHPLLQAAAVQAAYGARFSPTQLSGQPVKVTGTISYNFVQ